MDIRSNWITSTLGGIVFFIGIMFPAFLLKFFFPIKENRNTVGVEITAKEHPRLFDFVHHLVKEVNCSSPAKIFLSADVNAAVFYNSSFWSMFFPIRKNLLIGLGLVNSINISEFKAVLAHELGHISQRTMKIGSYVYILNRAIYNRIYEYDDFDLLLHKVAKHRGILGLVAGGVRFILNSIRTLLGETYKLIDRYYMELSREMEYNADLVALSVAGNIATISALRRINFGNEAYNQTIEHLSSLLKQKKITDNIFEKHLAMIGYIAKKKKLTLSRNLPDLNDDIIEDNELKSRLYFKGHGLTHPEQKEREDNINSVQVSAKINDDSPWLLFENPEKVQKEQTSAFYGKIIEDEEIEFINEAFFLESIDERKRKNGFPEIFNHFYDERYLFEYDISKLDEEVLELNIENIFNRENRKLIDNYYSNVDDRRVLEEIANGNIKIKTFDFDGKKYSWKDAKELVVQLNDEIENQKEEIIKLEMHALQIAYKRAKEKCVGEEFRSKLNLFIELKDKVDIIEGVRNRVERIKSYIKENFPLELYQIKLVEGSIDELYNSIKKELEEVKDRRIQIKIQNIEIDEPFDNYLLNAPLLFCAKGFFSYENFNYFCTQIYSMEYKINQACMASQEDFIYFQGDLFTA